MKAVNYPTLAYRADPLPVFLRDQSLTVRSLPPDTREFSLSSTDRLFTRPTCPVCNTLHYNTHTSADIIHVCNTLHYDTHTSADIIPVYICT